MNKDEIRTHFEDGDVPTGAEFGMWIERCLIWIDSADELPEAKEDIDGSCYLVGGEKVYRCELCDGEWKWVAKGSANGGGRSYLDLTNKPRLNGVVISGEKRLWEFGIMPDFSALKSTSVLSDNMRIVVGTDKGVAYTVTVKQLASLVGASTSRTGDGSGTEEDEGEGEGTGTGSGSGAGTGTGSGTGTGTGTGTSTEIVYRVSERRLFTMYDKPDGKSTDFKVEGKFVRGTAALYLNGQRMYPGIDFKETSDSSFVCLLFVPKEEDRILFEAVEAS